MNELDSILHKLTLATLSQIQKRHHEKGGTSTSVYVTSSVGGEGKTVTTAALAKYTALLTGMKVLCVDTNMEKPYLHKLFKCDNTKGFSECIRDNISDAEAMYVKTGSSNLTFLPAGQARRPGLLFRQHEVERFIDHQRRNFDLILFDGASIASSGANSLVYLSDNLILVVDSSGTRREIIQDCLSELNLEQEKILGVIMNKKRRFIPDFIYNRL